MVRRDALGRVGLFDPRLTHAEDLDFSLRLGRAGPLSYIPHVLLHYRRHSANATAVAPVHFNQIGREVYEHHYRLAQLRGEQEVAAAITERVGSERYFATAALRSASARLRDGDGAGAVAHARDAAASAHALTRATWRRAVRDLRERITAAR
jgi:GT2 family glycosyltransferase